MHLSKLQRFILAQSYRRPTQQISRIEFKQFYGDKKSKPKAKDMQNILSRSIERLIDNELAVGYGRRTPHKWFIENIRLTQKGRKAAKKLLGEQQKLPFAKTKNNKKG